VIFIGTADEEVDDEGSLWMIANKADLFKNAEYLLTEGGDNLIDGNSVKLVGVDVAEKAPFWLRLTASGLPGHGSRPVIDSAPNRLIRAMNRILDWETPVSYCPLSSSSSKTLRRCSRSRYARSFKTFASR
jgi:acetylornithine deacetylase/succinyl-diaminopimelate desuccinylase-like protein